MKPDSSQYIRTLTIAGSDSGGGAGIQADLKTFSALGCYGMSVLTALTAQNTQGVTGIHDVPAEFVRQQLDAVLGDIGADAVKVGMLHNPDTIHEVAKGLKRFDVQRVVLDPVMFAKSGDRLIRDEAVAALKSELLPLATVLTPNLKEAEALLGVGIDTDDDMEQAARKLAEMGPQAVVVKGGPPVTAGNDDCFCSQANGDAKKHWLKHVHVDTHNVHGTGCTFSSAIAAYLARGEALNDAVRQAKEYISAALENGAPYRLGHGKGPVAHFFKLWNTQI
ncbi:Hydroxymethylpyrimidine/phosphomethylpyrimidine kinase [Nitrospina gracilis 3/211]|uniref:hydroxymethylpyrimidine kinase n=1 Tax=Nitrospina gracilis (strain 3/211) TaxID=1266370 RepID=M1ZDP0_NITG3|nr:MULTISPECIES: bifunctional hydroxymethylpyrimidine kinase/phosphomethylpyrimidine kinase [Nitrospina]MCF8724447.1 hydroxymethylpyrimidine/phosphomethylpyrimidine kinase [Nitrospina sp. Nb-3]CCQ91605.1 Hydroxymethylpyrimidine/phosphomethylpyrimidine kinase [Nitrospina gracilis 3/211]